MKPKRVQRKRTKGWRMPENTIYVGRGSKWGNPYPVSGAYTLESSLSLYENKLYTADTKKPRSMYGVFDRIMADINELRGKNLACWCPLDKPCHADILLKLANK